MRIIEQRAYVAGLEVRDDGRHIIGRAVPYNEVALIGAYAETFAPGAFADADPATVALTATHPRSGDTLPIGITTELYEEHDGLHGMWRVSDTELGNDVLTLVRDGAVTGLSIGFIAGEDRWNRDRTRVERITATLDHIAVVRSPAYTGARIAAVRAEQSFPLLTLARRRTHP
jgi:HK97 family phage prohead protease